MNDPQSAQDMARQATLLRQQGNPKEAFTLALRAIEADNAVAEGWECAGYLLIHHKKWGEARKLLALAIKAVPESAAVNAYYAFALAKDGDPAQGYRYAQRALQLQPGQSAGIMARIECYCEAGYFDLALRDTALLQDKNIPDSTSFAFGSLAFMSGDYLRGLKAMIRVINSGWRGGEMPEWQGEKTDKHVVFYSGQGYGDMLQFLRYLPLLLPRVGPASLFIPRVMARLMRDSFPDLDLFIFKEDAGRDDIPLPPGTGIGVPDAALRSSFPALATFAENFDARATAIPYLRADRVLVEGWRRRLASRPRPWMASPGRPEPGIPATKAGFIFRYAGTGYRERAAASGFPATGPAGGESRTRRAFQRGAAHCGLRRQRGAYRNPSIS